MLLNVTYCIIVNNYVPESDFIEAVKAVSFIVGRVGARGLLFCGFCDILLSNFSLDWARRIDNKMEKSFCRHTDAFLKDNA